MKNLGEESPFLGEDLEHLGSDSFFLSSITTSEDWTFLKKKDKMLMDLLFFKANHKHSFLPVNL